MCCSTKLLIHGLLSFAFLLLTLEVFRIRPAEGSFWRQLEGSIDFGFGYASGSQQSQADLSAGATYRREGYTLTARLDSAFSSQSGARSSNRNDVAVVYRKALTQRWFAGSLMDFLNSSQQSLDLRTTAGGMIAATSFTPTELPSQPQRDWFSRAKNARRARW